jgi:HPt (histidine-containing phosphotransfer) domain-containing protein
VPVEPPVLDMEILTGLESVLSRPELTNFISLYLIDLERRLAGIAECHAQDDFVGVSQQAHTIVSTAGNLGAMKTSTVARRLETACRRGEQDRAISLIGELTRSCESSTAALKAWSDSGVVARPTAIAS